MASPFFYTRKPKNDRPSRPLGDPIAIEKLSEVFRERYAEQMEELTHEIQFPAFGKIQIQDMALFGITDSYERVFLGCNGIIQRPNL